jgi:hypothetical protein
MIKQPSIEEAQSMLEALKKANEILNDHFGIDDSEEGGNPAHDQIRAAIAKAEGRTK